MTEIELWESEIANERSRTFEKLITQATFLTEAIDMDCKIIEQVELNEGAKEIFTGLWNKIKTAFSKIADFFIGLANKIREKFSAAKIKEAENEFNSSDSDDDKEIGEAVDFLKEERSLGVSTSKKDGEIEFRYIIFDLNAFDTSLKKFDIDHSFIKNFKKRADISIGDPDVEVDEKHGFMVGSDDNQFYRQKDGKFASYLASEKILDIFEGSPKTLDDVKPLNLDIDENGKWSNPDFKRYSSLTADSVHTVSAKNKRSIKNAGKNICKINMKMNVTVGNTYVKLGNYIKKIANTNIKEFGIDDQDNSQYVKAFSQITSNMIHVLRNDQKLAAIIQTVYALNFSTMLLMLKELKKTK